MRKDVGLMKIVVVVIVFFALTSVALSVGAAAEVNHLSVDGAWALKETIKDPMVIAETGTRPTSAMVIRAETPPNYFNFRGGIDDSSAYFNWSWESANRKSNGDVIETFCTGQVHEQSTWTIPPSTLVPGQTMKTDLEASFTASQDDIQSHPSCYRHISGHCIGFSITGFRGAPIGVGLCVEGYKNELSKKSSETIEWSVPQGIPGDTLEIKICPFTTGMGMSDNAIHFIYEYKEEAPTTTPGACDWTGTWDTGWGKMVLVQTGKQVTGTYEHDNGKIEGIVSGNTLTGTWSEAPSYSPQGDAGDIEFTISPDCNSFTGKWRYGSAGGWSGWDGTRVSVASTPTPTLTPTPAPTPGACDWTGTWDTGWGKMVLVQTGKPVTGTYEHDNGKIEGIVSGNTLTGTWSEAPSYSPPNDAGDIEFTISPDCNSFTGKWRYGSAGGWSSWDGTRVSVASTPTPTLTPTPAPTPGKFKKCVGDLPYLYVEGRVMGTEKTVEIPIMMCNAEELANMDLDWSYDASVLKIIEVTKGSLNKKAVFEWNEVSPGKLKISFASSKGVTGSGSIAVMKFKVIGNPGDTSTLTGTVTTASKTDGSKISVGVNPGKFTVGSSPIKGDCDGDNALTVKDALAALQMSVEKRAVDMCYDYNGDGKVDSSDARDMLKAIVGKK